MRYMMFIKHTEDYRGKTIPAELIAAMGEFIAENSRKGKFIDGAGLKSSHKGKKIELRGGQLRVVDGPFTESKEIIGGYAIVDAESEQEALDIATQFMELHRKHWPGFEGESELRPFETGAPGSE
jgi:hypothetical protein